MSDWIPKAGDTVYSARGEEGQYIAPNPDGGHAVFALYEIRSGGDEGPDTGFRTEEWRRVFPTAPVVRVEASIAEGEERLAKIKAELRETQDALSRAQRENREHLERLTKRNAVLERLEEILDGKMTHAVVEEGYDRDVRIVEMAKLVNDEGRVRMISLFAANEYRKPEWAVNEYACGSSGRWDPIHMFSSHEEALECARGLIMAKLEKWRANKTNDARPGWLVKEFQRCGLPVPQDLTDFLEDRKVADARKKLEEAEQAKALAEAALAKLKGEEAAA